MKKNSGFIFLYLLLTCTGLYCKKETETVPPDPDVTGISAKINGQWRTFYFQPVARKWGSYSYIFQGYEGSISGHLLQIAFDTPTPLIPGTYSSTRTPAISVRIFYGNEYFFTHSSWEATNTPAFGQKDETVTISEITGNVVKGSFSCTLFPTSFSDRKTLIDGNFNVNF